jgi:signal transduction histidine kinase/CheY-like chemotaxis protein
MSQPLQTLPIITKRKNSSDDMEFVNKKKKTQRRTTQSDTQSGTESGPETDAQRLEAELLCVKAENAKLKEDNARLTRIYESPDLCAGIALLVNMSQDKSWEEIVKAIEESNDDNYQDLIDMRLTSVNQATAHALGVVNAQTTHSMVEIVKPTAPKDIWRLWCLRFAQAAANPGKAVNLEYSRYNKYRGSRSWLSGPIICNDSDPPQAAFVWTDSTAYQEALITLQQTLKQLQEADNLKSALIATISHELITPLTGILGLSTLLMEDSENLREEQIEHLRVVRRCGDELLRLVNSVLLSAKLESNMLQLDFGTVDIRGVANYAVSLVNARNTEHTIHDRQKPIVIKTECIVEDNVPHQIWCDEGSLKTILINLLSNASKFSEGHPVQLTISLKPTIPINGIINREPTLSLAPISRTLSSDFATTPSNETVDAGWIEFRITDRGIGIPPEKLEKLFKPFTQLHSREHNVGGSGLGLSIAHRLVAALGGRIGVESSVSGPDQGSQFWFVIPNEPAQDAVVLNQTPFRVASPLDGDFARHYHFSRILCVEDNSVTMSVLLRFLKKFGYSDNVDTAVDGLEGLEKSMENTYDLIICDMHMPRMTGTDMCKALRKMNCQQPVFIIASASALDADRRCATDSGADFFVSKPLTKDLLKQTLLQAHEKK